MSEDNPDSKKPLGKENLLSKDDRKELPVFKSNKLFVHFMVNKNREIGNTISKIYNQEVMWKKRMWPLDSTAFISDKKGFAHIYLDINEADGTLRFNKSYVDKCVECGNTIGQDAVNTRDLLKRKTISAIWGIDNSHIMLLLIMGIVLMILAVAVFYMYGENQKLVSKLATLVPPTSATANILYGVSLIE